MSSKTQGALPRSAIKVNAFMPSHCHCMGVAVVWHSNSASDAVVVATTGLQLPKQGQPLPVERCTTALCISNATFNDQTHEFRSSHFGLLGPHFVPFTTKGIHS